MLRVYLHDSVLKLEGRLTAADADHICTLMTSTDTQPKILIDLTDVTFVDLVGETVLSFLGRGGAEFIAETAYSLDVCERLGLRLTRNGRSETLQSEVHGRSSRMGDA